MNLCKCEMKKCGNWSRLKALKRRGTESLARALNYLKIFTAAINMN